MGFAKILHLRQPALSFSGKGKFRRVFSHRSSTTEDSVDWNAEYALPKLTVLTLSPLS